MVGVVVVVPFAAPSVSIGQRAGGGVGLGMTAPPPPPPVPSPVPGVRREVYAPGQYCPGEEHEGHAQDEDLVCDGKVGHLMVHGCG